MVNFALLFTDCKSIKHCCLFNENDNYELRPHNTVVCISTGQAISYIVSALVEPPVISGQFLVISTLDKTAYDDT